LQRGKGTIYVLVRRSRSASSTSCTRSGQGQPETVVPIKGDLGQPKLGVARADLTRLKGKIKHFYHLGAVYDLEASADAMEKANITGTRARWNSRRRSMPAASTS
jgi:thioester reductase-like protein